MAESKVNEYNSYTKYNTVCEIHKEIPFHAIFGFHTDNNFLNSRTLNLNENKLLNTSLASPLIDKKYIKLLSKIGKDFSKINDIDIKLYFVEKKFSEIYEKVSCFKFEEMSVEYTYDNSLLFSIRENGSKYLLEYYLDYNADSYDDVEIIFTQLNNRENKFYEMRLEEVNDFLRAKVKNDSISYLLFE